MFSKSQLRPPWQVPPEDVAELTQRVVDHTMFFTAPYAVFGATNPSGNAGKNTVTSSFYKSVNTIAKTTTRIRIGIDLGSNSIQEAVNKGVGLSDDIAKTFSI